MLPLFLLDKMNSILFDTPFGRAALVYHHRQIARILLPTPDLQVLQAELFPYAPNRPGRHPGVITDLAHRIQAYLNGNPARLPLELLEFSRCTPFKEQVLRVEYTIPYGQVRTYKWVAEQLEKPRAARAVGNALARNPFPLVIPCHRCIRSNGTLGGFQRPGLKEKLLKLEGAI